VEEVWLKAADHHTVRCGNSEVANAIEEKSNMLQQDMA